MNWYAPRTIYIVQASHPVPNELGRYYSGMRKATSCFAKQAFARVCLYAVAYPKGLNSMHAVLHKVITPEVLGKFGTQTER